MIEWVAAIKNSIISSVRTGFRLAAGVRQHRTALIAVLVAVLSIGVVGAGIVFFTTSAQTDVHDPIDRKIMTWQGGTTESITLSNKNNQDYYVLKMRLINYSGLTGHDALVQARQDYEQDGDYIHRVLVTNHSKGIQEDVRRDLLTDGNITYHYVPAGGDVSIEIYADSDGAVGLTRTTHIPNEVSVRVHRSTYSDECGYCHNASAPPTVHQDMNATHELAADYKNRTCYKCHENSMNDLHQKCQIACHDDGFPINATYDNGTISKKHGPSEDVTMVQGEYYCGPGCHLGEHDAGSDETLGSMGAAHILALGDDSQTYDPNSYCPKCHKRDISGYSNRGILAQHMREGTDLPVEPTSDCSRCHGVGWYSTHGYLKYGMDMNDKRYCGLDGGCHV